MKRTLLATALLLCAATAFGGFVIHNEDCTAFFCSFGFSADEAGARKYLAQHLEAGSDSVKIMMLNTQGQKYMRPAWTLFERDEQGQFSYKGKPINGTLNTMYNRMRSMSEAGVDVWRVWIAQCREVGVSPWISLRMNDVHGADEEDSYMMYELWRQHHEYWLNTYYPKFDWFARQLDYAHPEVRKYYMDIVAELLERYDCDGIELDFMRFGHVFRYGHELEDAHFLTEFVREARRRCDEKAKAVGHKVGLAVRVPADPRDAHDRGFDVETWLDEGLVDILTPTVFWSTNWDDVPVHIWRKLVRNRVLLAIGIESRNCPPGLREAVNCFAPSGEPFTNALADLYYARGADAVYTFNCFRDNRKFYRELANPATVAALRRRMLMTCSDCRRAGSQNERALPATVGGSMHTQLRLSIGTKPEPGRAARLVIGSKQPFPDGNLPEARLNGVPLSAAQAPDPAEYTQELQQLCAYALPDGTLTTDGNVIELHWSHAGSITVNWVEIDIAAK